MRTTADSTPDSSPPRSRPPGPPPPPPPPPPEPPPPNPPAAPPTEPPPAATEPAAAGFRRGGGFGSLRGGAGGLGLRGCGRRLLGGAAAARSCRVGRFFC